MVLPDDFFHPINYSKKRGKSSESIACIGHIAASVILKLFINGYERRETMYKLLSFLLNSDTFISTCI